MHGLGKTGPDGDYSDIYELIQKLAALRKEKNMAEGEVKIYAESDVLILVNTASEREIKLLINNTATAQTADDVTMKPYSFQVSLNGGVLIYE